MKYPSIPMDDKELALTRIERRKYRLRLLVKLGFNEDDMSGWRRKWMTVFKRCARNKLVFKLSFSDYMKLVKKAKLVSPEDIGRSLTKYQLGRIGDKGPYTLKTCRFITAAQNQKEKILNGGHLTGGYKISTAYKFLDPTGHVVSGRNLADLCRENNLSYSKMSGVRSKRRIAHKRWTLA